MEKHFEEHFQESCGESLEERLNAAIGERDALRISLQSLMAAADLDKEVAWSSMASEVAETLFPILALMRRKFPAEKDFIGAVELVVAGLGIRKFREAALRTFRLTLTEYRVAQYVRVGFSETEIAEMLGISISTLKKHKNSLRAKVGGTGSPLALRELLETTVLNGAL